MTAAELRHLARIRSVDELKAYLKSRGQKAKKSVLRTRRSSEASKAEMRAIVTAVHARANGHCEACHKPFTWLDPVQFDHWLGGVGRRRQMQSVQTVWAIHQSCHHERTNNLPSAGFWNALFANFCIRNGYTQIRHIEHAPLRGRA